jgi:hypothetical protein
MMFGLITPSRHFGPGRAPVFREQHYRSHLRSEERSQYLLRQWLSPDQAEQYDIYRRFDVVGSNTGTRYRIRRGTTMNIEELAADGHVARRWCFAPEGAFATGDVMLAQKIALETFELEALAIANCDGPRGAEIPRLSVLHIDELGLMVLAFACFITLAWSVFHILL